MWACPGITQYARACPVGHLGQNMVYIPGAIRSVITNWAPFCSRKLSFRDTISRFSKKYNGFWLTLIKIWFPLTGPGLLYIGVLCNEEEKDLLFVSLESLYMEWKLMREESIGDVLCNIFTCANTYLPSDVEQMTPGEEIQAQQEIQQYQKDIKETEAIMNSQP